MTRRFTLVLLMGCAARTELGPNAPCENVGYAIASRIHACTGDPQAANAAYESFDAQATCAAQGNPSPEDFACAASITAMRCRDLDPEQPLEAWLADPSCDVLFGAPSDSGVAR